MTAIPATMSGVPLIRQVGPGELVWRDDIPVPRPGPGEALVRVLAAGVNMADTHTRLDRYGGEGRQAGWVGETAFPRGRGADLFGRIVALGEGVDHLPLGARVIGPTNRHDTAAEDGIAFVSIGSEVEGAFAQYCLVRARLLDVVSASVMTDTEVGAMPCAYGTAHNLLTRARVAVGERVLVTGASGGAGLAAVQLAMLRGAEVTAHCSLSKSALLRGIGAGILSRDSTPPARAFDVVIDMVGGDGFQDRLDALCPGGRYATSAAVAGPMVKGELRRFFLNDLVDYGSKHQPREVFAGLVTVIYTARLRPIASRTYPLRDIAREQTDLSVGRSPGKLVLVPQEIGT